MPGTGNTTVPTPLGTPFSSSSGDPHRLVLCLFLAWSSEQPERVGERALFDPFTSGAGPCILGREIDGGPARVHFVQLRPGEIIDGGPLVGLNISQEQLAVTVEGDALLVRNAGNAVVKVDDVDLPRDASVLARPGSVIEVFGNCVLLVGRSPLSIPHSAAKFLPLHAFGEPDRLGMTGESALMWQLREDIAYVAGTGSNVLVSGETGTGKECVARGIHDLSPRASGPYKMANVGAFVSTLATSELFGNRKGYPNGNQPEREGYVGAARGGSLLLDEIGEALVEAQVPLLRALQGWYERGGDPTTRRVECIIILSTNNPAGIKFDVFHRFPNHIETPTLAARPEDLAQLLRALLLRKADKDSAFAQAFVRQDSRGWRYVLVDASLIVGLLRSPLEGNVRGIEKIVEASTRAARGVAPLRWPERLSLRPSGPPPPAPVRPQIPASAPPPAVARPAVQEDPDAPDVDALLSGMQGPPDLSKERVERALMDNRHHKAKTATALGITYDQLYRLRKKYGLD